MFKINCRLNEFKKKTIIEKFKNKATIKINDYENNEGYISIISVEIGKLSSSVASDTLNKDRTAIQSKNFQKLQSEIESEIEYLKKRRKIEEGV